MSAAASELADLVASSGLRRVHALAWRDLDDPGAAGSEIHLTELARRWVEAGVEVSLFTGATPGAPAEVVRHGIRVHRRGGALGVWARNPVLEALGRNGPADALLEVWHGVSFFAPLWARVPTVGIAHHVHADQFHQVLPPGLAHLAELLEASVYPRLYRDTPLLTLSEPVRDDLAALGYRRDRIVVVTPGVDERFAPGGARSAVPLVASVGRFMPQTGHAALVEALVAAKRRCPTLEAVLAGEGPERAGVIAQVAAAGATPWLSVPGRLDDASVVELYQRAWVLASASRKEGWGMTVTEAGACATPSVVTRIPGHEGAVIDGRTGLLVDTTDELADGLVRVLTEPGLAERLGEGARRHAALHRWDDAALAAFSTLADEAERWRANGRRRRRPRP